jgi:Uma2 family endonuclease
MSADGVLPLIIPMREHVIPLASRPMEVTEYEQLVKDGVLTKDDKIELLEGWIIAQERQTPAHAYTRTLLWHQLEKVLPPGWFHFVRSPIITDDSEPEPDESIVRGELDDFVSRHPGPADLGLVIEVADASLEKDQRVKQRIYARAGIPFYWLINLVDKALHVYSHPSGATAEPSYRQLQILDRTENVLLILDGQIVATIPVVSLLPYPKK